MKAGLRLSGVARCDNNTTNKNVIKKERDMSKKSIRFFNDREVRAVWDEKNSKWWFSATDIVRAVNDEEDYVKAGNYWRWLKKKLTTDGIQLVSVTHDFRFQAPDGKQRYADALDAECVQTVAKNYPNNRARKFLDWFIYSDSSIDGQSKKKAYTLIESGLMDTAEQTRVQFFDERSGIAEHKERVTRHEIRSVMN